MKAEDYNSKSAVQPETQRKSQNYIKYFKIRNGEVKLYQSIV